MSETYNSFLLLKLDELEIEYLERGIKFNREGNDKALKNIWKWNRVTLREFQLIRMCLILRKKNSTASSILSAHYEVQLLSRHLWAIQSVIKRYWIGTIIGLLVLCD